MQKHWVPVIDKNNQPLMPCSPARARELLKSGRAIKRWFGGLFAIKLIDRDVCESETQDVIIGIDPGSKREGLTIKSRAHTLLNLQAEAIDWVKDKVTTRREMRRARRFRKTPCRQNRVNRARGGLPPSTKARWQWKLRLLNWLAKVYPVAYVVVEDIAAVTREGKSRWNTSFSPLEVGKRWMYAEIEKRWPLETYSGYETKAERDRLGLSKSTQKLAETFDAHCVDSWALTNTSLGGDAPPENTDLLIVRALRFARRQLHKLQPAKGGERASYGSTRSMGFERGSLVKHPKWGLAYIGGSSKERITLHSFETGERLCRNAKPADLLFLTFNRQAVRSAQA